MAEQTLVDEIQGVLKQLRAAKGDFVLAMLYSTFEQPTAGWNLIVSAPWAEELTLGEAVRTTTRAMAQTLSKKRLSLISRVTVLKTSDPFVERITSVFAVEPGSSSQIVNCNFGGVEIPHAWILQAQRKVKNARVHAR